MCNWNWFIPSAKSRDLNRDRGKATLPCTSFSMGTSGVDVWLELEVSRSKGKQFHNILQVMQKSATGIFFLMCSTCLDSENLTSTTWLQISTEMYFPFQMSEERPLGYILCRGPPDCY